jgi:hypothetical protein
VIIGRLIPAGTGFEDMEYELIGDVEARRNQRSADQQELADEIDDAFADNIAVAEGVESMKEL